MDQIDWSGTKSIELNRMDQTKLKLTKVDQMDWMPNHN